MKLLWKLTSLSLLMFFTACSASTQSGVSLPQNGPTPTTSQPTTQEEKPKKSNYAELVKEAVKKWDFSRDIPQNGWSKKDWAQYTEHLQTSADNLSCEKSKECPDSVAALMIHFPMGSGWSGGGFNCTGTLVTSDIVVTNAHCVEHLYQGVKNFSGCALLLQVAFPKTATASKEVIPCGRLIGSAPPKEEGTFLSPDYAFIRLMWPAKRKPARINRNGLPNSGSVNVIQHTTNEKASFKWIFKKTKCLTAQNSLLAPDFQNLMDAMVHFGDCPIGPGDSGSPAFNEEGELVAIMGGQYPPSRLLDISDALLAMGLADEKPTWRGWGTNFSCIPDVNDPASGVNSTCEAVGLQKKSIVITEEQYQTLDAKIAEWGQSHSEFGWGRTPVKGTFLDNLAQPVPNCVRKQGAFAVDLSIPRIGLKTNKLLQLTNAAQIARLTATDASISVVPQSAGKAKVTLSPKGANLAFPILPMDEVLPYCAN